MSRYSSQLAITLPAMFRCFSTCTGSSPDQIRTEVDVRAAALPSTAPVKTGQGGGLAPAGDTAVGYDFEGMVSIR